MLSPMIDPELFRRSLNRLRVASLAAAELLELPDAVDLPHIQKVVGAELRDALAEHQASAAGALNVLLTAARTNEGG